MTNLIDGLPPAGATGHLDPRGGADDGLDALLRSLEDCPDAPDSTVRATPVPPPAASPASAATPAPPPVVFPASDGVGSDLAATVDRMRAAVYEFPEAASLSPFRDSASTMTDRDILRRLWELQQKVVGTSPDPRDYITTRGEVCALNLVLNERRSIAPAFRPHRKAAKTGAKDRSMIDRWIVGDRAVIDLHWHRTRGVTPTEEFRPVFESAEFSLKDASSIARRRLKTQTKADAVGLSEVDQLLGSVIRSPAARGRWQTILERRTVIRRILLDLRPQPRYRLTPQAIDEIQHAALALLIGRGSATVASSVIAHVGGSPTPADRLRDAKKRLERLGCVPRGWGD